MLPKLSQMTTDPVKIRTFFTSGERLRRVTEGYEEVSGTACNLILRREGKSTGGLIGTTFSFLTSVW